MTENERILKKAIALNKDKKYQEVNVLLTDEILERYNDVDLYTQKTIVLFRLKNYEDCEKFATKAYKLDPKKAKINNYLGHIYSNKKEYENAEMYYRNALEIEPNSSNSSNSYNGLGILYYEKKEYEKAEEYYKKAIELDSNFSLAYNNLGILYKDKIDYEAAEEYHKKAIELDSNSPNAYNSLGILYYEKEEYEKAEEYYKKAIEIDPNYSNTYYNIGIIYFDKKDYEKAKEYYKKYIELKNDKKEYFSKLAESKIEEIDKILESPSYERISNLIEQIKELLLFKGEFITHYTGISTAQILVLNKSPMRLSEGSFLNDTSEGEELFKFLDYFLSTNKKSNEILFTKRPFIGSFVDDEKNNDLTLWRMYGKEALEEAKGCSISITH